LSGEPASKRSRRDGAWIYNAQELSTAKRHGINLVTVVFNDSAPLRLPLSGTQHRPAPAARRRSPEEVMVLQAMPPSSGMG